MSVWVDTDFGFDDIMAILLLKQAGCKIDGLSLVAGNTPLEQVARNAVSASACFAWPEPIFCGAAGPVEGEPTDACKILGQGGMRSTGQYLPPADENTLNVALQTDAFEALAAWLGNCSGRRRILALGPLTNIALLIEARPELASRIAEIVWMGGSAAGGNHTQFAEFNAFADPQAVDIVLHHGIALKMVGLDVCRTVTVDLGEIAALRSAQGKLSGLLSDLLEGYIRIAISRGRETMALYDPTAAAALVHPDVVFFSPAHIGIQLSDSERRGMTEIGYEPEVKSNAHIAISADGARIRELTMAALLAEAGR